MANKANDVLWVINSGAPICLVAYGEENDKYLAFSGLGKWVKL